MPKFVIDREIPGVGKFSANRLHAITQTFCEVLNKLGPGGQWIHSYITGDKIYCVYNAPNSEIVREHAKGAVFQQITLQRFQQLLTLL